MLVEIKNPPAYSIDDANVYYVNADLNTLSRLSLEIKTQDGCLPVKIERIGVQRLDVTFPAGCSVNLSKILEAYLRSAGVDTTNGLSAVDQSSLLAAINGLTGGNYQVRDGEYWTNPNGRDISGNTDTRKGPELKFILVGVGDDVSFAGYQIPVESLVGILKNVDPADLYTIPVESGIGPAVHLNDEIPNLSALTRVDKRVGRADKKDYTWISWLVTILAAASAYIKHKVDAKEKSDLRAHEEYAKKKGQEIASILEITGPMGYKSTKIKEVMAQMGCEELNTIRTSLEKANREVETTAAVGGDQYRGALKRRKEILRMLEGK